MISRFAFFSAAVLASACSPKLEDNSLGTPSIGGDFEDGGGEFAGDLAVTSPSEGNWELTIDGVTFEYHSPSQADLSGLAGGAEVAVETELEPRLIISDDEGLAFASISGIDDDGSDAFGRPVWSFGDSIGRGVVVNEFAEEQKVVFKEVSLEADDGAVTLLPGEPTTVLIEGVSYRATVLAAYSPDRRAGAKCGPPDVLTIELVRGEASSDESLQREDGAVSPTGVCG